MFTKRGIATFYSGSVHIVAAGCLWPESNAAP
jgi:hypothetical protein